MKRHLFALFSIIALPLLVLAADPMATDFTMEQCCGSLAPYPTDIKPVSYPDTLKPMMINHVGRHGARFPASDTFCRTLAQALESAADQGTITHLGRKLLALTEYTMTTCANRWGALDSLGEYEQRMIASRMYENFRPVFDKAHVRAISSYSPRCMMSMYSFTHQLDRLNNKMDFTTSTGRMNSALLRPFDTDPDFKTFVSSPEVMDVYNVYYQSACPLSAIERVLGKDFAYESDDQRRELALYEYYVLASMGAMGVDCRLADYFTRAEINALWSIFNLRQYLQRTATTVSMLPADIASDLLLDIVNTTDAYVEGTSSTNVMLRFGHAETLMPLLSLMRLKGCYYMTNYFDTVARNWQDFNIVPMAANLQLILFRHVSTGEWYVRVDLNERPVPLIPNSTSLYTPWQQARAYLMHCIPSYNINKE